MIGLRIKSGIVIRRVIRSFTHMKTARRQRKIEKQVRGKKIENCVE